MLAAWSASGCRYVANRAQDFIEPYRLNVGVTLGGGARAYAGGLVHTGLMVGTRLQLLRAGLSYGVPYYFSQKGSGLFAFDQDTVLVGCNASYVDVAWEDGEYRQYRRDYGILPLAFSWVDNAPGIRWTVPKKKDSKLALGGSHHLWSGHTLEHNRWAVIHAFDLEAVAGLGVYADAGFSPGEFLDFVLGIFTIDIAADDEPASEEGDS